ncbi:MAG: hypothetical protein HOW73_01430 [Polyangiaceae bacterium]|nr:hypothetical protein [Polyangiaceae bacterium]
MTRAAVLLGAVLLGCFAVACGSSRDDAAQSSAGPSAGAAAASSSVNESAAAKAVCETKTADEHFCVEMDDDELAAEREKSCVSGFARDRSCAREGVLGVCRLPDGSLRFGYPPKTLSSHEKACKELQGRFAAGSTIPAKDNPTVVACEGKYDDACEEEEIFVSTRIGAAADECKAFGGKFRETGRPCVREGARFSCDLPGKRTIVSSHVTSAEAAERFCTERNGKYRDLAPPPASSATAAAASASAPVDPDPLPAKPDVVIRQQ